MSRDLLVVVPENTSEPLPAADLARFDRPGVVWRGAAAVVQGDDEPAEPESMGGGVVKGVIRSGDFQKQPNVSRLVNFYQRQHTTSIAGQPGSRFHGNPVSGADVDTELLAADFDPSKFDIARNAGIGQAPAKTDSAAYIVANAHLYVGIQDATLRSLIDEVKRIPEERSDYKHP